MGINKIHTCFKCNCKLVFIKSYNKGYSWTNKDFELWKCPKCNEEWEY